MSIRNICVYGAGALGGAYATRLGPGATDNPTTLPKQDLALTRAQMNHKMANFAVAVQVAQVMRETKAVAEALGVTIENNVNAQINLAEGFGRLAGVSTPTCETVLALTTQLDAETAEDELIPKKIPPGEPAGL
jgi:hypothetical protein